MSDNGIFVEEAGAVPDKPERPRLSDADVRSDLHADEVPVNDVRANGSDMVKRAVDYLDGFYKQKPAAQADGEPGGPLYDGVIEALKEIYDPEIPVNIYDLGLVYNVEFADAHAIVTMTLTTPNCPVAESMPGEVEMRVGAVPGVGSAEVNLVWDPPWDPQKMSDEAKLELGML